MINTVGCIVYAYVRQLLLYVIFAPKMFGMNVCMCGVTGHTLAVVMSLDIVIRYQIVQEAVASGS